MDGADDLAAVYALQVNACDAEVRVPELPLDDDERDTFVRHLDRVGVSQPAVGPWITHSSAPMGSSPRISSQGSSWSHAQRSIPTSRRLPPFPRRTSTAPRVRSRSLS